MQSHFYSIQQFLEDIQDQIRYSTLNADNQFCFRHPQLTSPSSSGVLLGNTAGLDKTASSSHLSASSKCLLYPKGTRTIG